MWLASKKLTLVNREDSAARPPGVQTDTTIDYNSRRLTNGVPRPLCNMAAVHTL